jgi:acyl carrier protein
MNAERPTSTVARLRHILLRIFGRLLESAELSIDDDFFDKGGDSLLATELMLELEHLAGRPLPQTLLFEASTVRTLADALRDAGDLAPKAAVRIGPPQAGQTPLLFFHGDWTGGGFYVKPLAQQLAPEFPLVAVAPHGMIDDVIPPTIEAMAADRLPALTKIQPQGPYRLGGHCVGGMVAFEAARMLMAGGHRVEFVAMVDPIFMVNGSPLTMVRAEPKAAPASGADPRDAEPVPHWQQYAEVLAAYAPRPLAAPIAVFMSEFDGRPWAELSPACALFDLPGGHHDWVTSHAASFAARLKSLRDRGQASEREAGRHGLLGAATGG